MLSLIFSFTNREIAASVWIAVFFAWMMTNGQIRLSLYGLIKAFFSRYILFSLVLMIAWSTASVCFLSSVGMWQFENLKATVLWFVSFALSMLIGANKTLERNFFRKTIREAIGLTVIVEFVAALHSFTFFAELFLVPVIVTMAVLQAFAATQPKFSAASAFLRWPLVFAGFAYFFLGVTDIVRTPGSFFSLATFREFAVPVLLSLLFLPLMYALKIWLGYEVAISPILGQVKSKRLRAFIHNRFAISFRLDVDLAKRWARLNIGEPLDDREKIGNSIDAFLIMKANEDFPKMVPFTSGWSPYAARDFLLSEGIGTDRYELSHAGWSAGGFWVTGEVDDLNSISYTVEGDDSVVRSLTLDLDRYDPPKAHAAETTFWKAAETLVRKAIGPNFANNLLARKLSVVDEYWGGCHVQLSSAELGHGSSITLVIRRE